MIPSRKSCSINKLERDEDRVWSIAFAPPQFVLRRKRSVLLPTKATESP
jgi:hypothetical protein